MQAERSSQRAALRRPREASAETEQDGEATGNDAAARTAAAGVRTEYRNLIAKTQECREVLSDPRNGELSELLSESSALFRQVSTTRDAALDSELFANFAAISSSKVLRINTAVKGFDVDSFMARLAEMLSPEGDAGEGDAAAESSAPSGRVQGTLQRRWAELARLPAGVWRGAVGADALYGPMYPGPDGVFGRERGDSPAANQQQQQRQRTRNAQGKSTQPLEKTRAVEAADVASKTEAETGKLVHLVVSSLERATARGPVEFWRFVVNPQSFGQSVENLFYVSFLVKDGQAKLNLRDGTLFICLFHSYPPVTGSPFFFPIVTIFTVFADSSHPQHTQSRQPTRTFGVARHRNGSALPP